MTGHRWPEAECLHEHATGTETVCNHVGKLMRTIPGRCPECGKVFHA